MNLKNKAQAILVGICLLAAPSLSMASTGAENILGKQFCTTQGILNSGWGFSEDGAAYYFAPNIGAPNPFIYHRVTFLRHPNIFWINKYEKGTNKLIQRVATFTYEHSTQSITSGSDVLSVSSCK